MWIKQPSKPQSNLLSYPLRVSTVQTHLPGYVADADKIKEKGVDVIACVSVNDAFVMSAWGESSGATGKIRMLADTAAEFTKVGQVPIQKQINIETLSVSSVFTEDKWS